MFATFFFRVDSRILDSKYLSPILCKYDTGLFAAIYHYKQIMSQSYETIKYEGRNALFKYPVRTAQ